MFVRIKKRALLLDGSKSVTDYSIRVMIVESYRKDGKPRQRVLKYLGSIRLSELQSSVAKKAFIHLMQQKLDTIDLKLSLREITALKMRLVHCLYHTPR